MKIGQVAACAGVNVDTLRYYERRGLIEEPARRSSGYREYPEDVVLLVRFIKRAQDLGFTLKEIADLLSLRDGAGRQRDRVLGLAESKVREIDRKLSRLQAMRAALSELVESCSCAGGRPTCPILEALNDPADEALPELRRRSGSS